MTHRRPGAAEGGRGFHLFKSRFRRGLFGKSFLSVVSTPTSLFLVPKVLCDAKTAETWWPMTFLRQGQRALGKSLQGLRSSLG